MYELEKGQKFLLWANEYEKNDLNWIEMRWKSMKREEY